jgi:hypothetical protein
MGLESFDNDQWYDPALERYGVRYARAMTRYLYANIVPNGTPSLDWPKYGLITQFDKALAFTLAAGATDTLTLQTNNRNWMLVCRSAIAADSTGAEASLVNLTVGCNADPGIQLMDVQPIKLVFGDGQLPSLMLFPEEWPTNTFRRWTVVNGSAGSRVVTLSFKFFQVRTG